MALPTIARIEIQLAAGYRRSSGCVVADGYVVTAARPLAPQGAGGDRVLGVKVWVGPWGLPVRRIAFLDNWTETLAPEANIALLDVHWGTRLADPFEIPEDWSFAGDTRNVLVRGHGGGGMLWHQECSVIHARSEHGLDSIQSDGLRPPPEAVGGPITPVSNIGSLVGVLTEVPTPEGQQHVGVPLTTVTYGALRQQLDAFRLRNA